MYGPRIGPANAYDPQLRAMAQRRPQMIQPPMPAPQIDQGLLAEGMRITPPRRFEDAAPIEQKPAPIEEASAPIPGQNPASPAFTALPTLPMAGSALTMPQFMPGNLLDIPTFNGGARFGQGDVMNYLRFLGR